MTCRRAAPVRRPPTARQRAALAWAAHRHDGRTPRERRSRPRRKSLIDIVIACVAVLGLLAVGIVW